MITNFEIHKPLRRHLGQTQRRNRRKIGKNGAVDMRRLDGVFQDLGFVPKPHPTIFIENEPEAVFDGLEKFRKSNGLKVDGAVKNKDRETGRALNKAMADFYVPTKPKQTRGTQNGPEEAELPDFDAELERQIEEKEAECADLQAEADDAEQNMDLNKRTPEGGRWQRKWRALLMDVQRCRFALGALRRRVQASDPERSRRQNFPSLLNQIKNQERKKTANSDLER